MTKRFHVEKTNPFSHVVGALGWLLSVVCAATAAGNGIAPLQNGGFESSAPGVHCQSIPGWTLHGAPTSAVVIDDDGSGPTLRITRGKVFCYSLGLDPEADYVLSVTVRCTGATPLVEASFPLPPGLGEDPPVEGFDWQTLTFQLPVGMRPGGTREMWIALGANALQAGGVVWFRDVKLHKADGGSNIVPNPRFVEPALDVEVVPGWVLDQGGAIAKKDSIEPHGGAHSLKLTGVERPIRLTQTIDLSSFGKPRPQRVRITAWGKCQGLARDRVRLEVYGAGAPVPPILSLSGDADWTRGEVVVDISRQTERGIAIWIHAPSAFGGTAWFDDIEVEPVPDDEVVNLLWNAAFEPSAACPELPDYWGLYGDALLCVEPWSFDLFGLSDEPGPVAGARVLQICHPAENAFVPLARATRLSMFVLTGASLDLPDGEYTFSIYAKADRPGTAVHIRHPASRDTLAEVAVGLEWQRIAGTSRNSRLLPAVHIPNPGSRVWLSAPQLEPGDKASPYRHSPGALTASGRKARELSAARQPMAPVPGRSSDPVEDAARLGVYAEFDRIETDAVLQARVEWTGPVPATVHWRTLDAATGQNLLTDTWPIKFDAAGYRTFSIPAAQLPMGSLGIQAVVDVGGRRKARAVDIVEKHAPSSGHVRINRFSRSVTVDDTAFFPVFLPIEPWKLRDWHLRRLRWAGFNCLVGAPAMFSQREVFRKGVSAEKATAIRNELDRLDAQGLKLFWPLTWSFDDWAETKELYHGDITGLGTTCHRIVAAFRDHPAIIGWYVVDEPSPAYWEKELGFSEADLQLLWAAVKNADPTRPAYTNWNHTWAHSPYGGYAATDVIGHDNYIISGESFDLEELVPSVRMINNAGPTPKPAFAWISGSYNEVAMRPTADAVRVHAWLHLIYGTRGLGYWAGPPMDPRVWTEMRTINRDAVVLHRHVLGESRARNAAQGRAGGSIHYSVWEIDDFAYLLAVNTAGSVGVLELDLCNAIGRDVVAARRLFDDRAIKVTAGRIIDTFPALSRQVYRFSLGETQP